MIKNILKISLAIVLPFLFGMAEASEVSGTMSNFLDKASGSISGTVEIPAPPPPPPPGGGGGGGPSGGSGQGGGGGGGGGGLLIPQNKSGDINADGKVDKYDFSLMMADWGKIGFGNRSDLNGDGRVDKYDFSILMARWIR